MGRRKKAKGLLLDPSLVLEADPGWIAEMFWSIEGVFFDHPDMSLEQKRQQLSRVINILMEHGGVYDTQRNEHIPVPLRLFIRDLYAKKIAGIAVLARRFNTSRMTIWRIIKEDTHGQLETSTDHRDM